MNENCAAALITLHTADNPLTTTETARRVFDTEDDGETVKNAERKVRYYFTDSYPHLVEEVGDTPPARYTTDDDAVWVGLGSVRVVSALDSEDEVVLGLGAVLLYLDEGGDPTVVNIGDGVPGVGGN